MAIRNEVIDNCKQKEASVCSVHDEHIHVSEGPSVLLVAFWVMPINSSSEFIEGLTGVTELW